MRLQERAADRRRPSSFASAFWRVLCYVIDRKWPTAEIEVPSEPVRVAPDSAEVFTSARPPARDVILASGLVWNRPYASKFTLLAVTVTMAANAWEGHALGKPGNSA